MLSDNSHDEAFVDMAQKKFEVIKATLPNIKNIEYFTDVPTTNIVLKIHIYLMTFLRMKKFKRFLFNKNNSTK